MTAHQFPSAQGPSASAWTLADEFVLHEKYACSSDRGSCARSEYDPSWRCPVERLAHAIDSHAASQAEEARRAALEEAAKLIEPPALGPGGWDGYRDKWARETAFKLRALATRREAAQETGTEEQHGTS